MSQSAKVNPVKISGLLNSFANVAAAPIDPPDLVKSDCLPKILVNILSVVLAYSLSMSV